MRRRIVSVLALALVLGGCGFDGIYDLPLPGNNRAAPLGLGTGSRSDAAYDPTLNGLVEVAR